MNKKQTKVLIALAAIAMNNREGFTVNAADLQPVTSGYAVAVADIKIHSLFRTWQMSLNTLQNIKKKIGGRTSRSTTLRKSANYEFLIMNYELLGWCCRASRSTSYLFASIFIMRTGCAEGTPLCETHCKPRSQKQGNVPLI